MESNQHTEEAPSKVVLRFLGNTEDRVETIELAVLLVFVLALISLKRGK